MKKAHIGIIEILGILLFVILGTLVVYLELSQVQNFWNAQKLWSIALIFGWLVVSLGYFNQGWKVRCSGSSDNVSIILPTAVFLVQCILFIKGIYYGDWSLIVGAVVVNSGVCFSLYQIIQANLARGLKGVR